MSNNLPELIDFIKSHAKVFPEYSKNTNEQNHDCPKCKDGQPNNFYFNTEKGVSNCLKCDAKYSPLQYAKILGYKPKWTNDPTWIYSDENGKPLFGINKYINTDGKKGFSQAVPVNGKWEFISKKNADYKSLSEAFKRTRKVLYNLPAVLKSDTVWIVEGEKCADKLQSILPENNTATTNNGGAKKFQKESAAPLHGKTVYIIPDNDKSGMEHATDVLSKTHKICNAKIITLKDLNEKDDIYDWINARQEKGLLGKDIFSELKTFADSVSDTQIINVEKKPPLNDAEILSQTDTRNTERFVEMYGDKFKFTNELGFIYWNDKFWENKAEIKILGLARDTAKKLTQEIVSKSGWSLSQLKDCKRTESKSGIGAMVSLSRIDTLIGIGDLDRESYSLNLSNGILDVKTLTLSPHKKEYFFTGMLNVEYNKDSDCPNFKQFLSEILVDDNGKTDQSLIEYVQEILGSCLVPIVKNEHWYFCSGNGNNGKSTLFKVMQSILGKYYSGIKSEVLMNKNNPDHPTSIASLFDSRMVVSSETSDGSKLNESLLKELTGRDLITARFMRQDEFSFYPKFKLFTFGNHKPQIRGTDNGIWRRVKLIPFNADIPKNKIKLDYNETLLKEKSGILNWLLDGLKRCIDNGWKIEEPDSVVNATKGYRESQDTIGQFLSELYWSKAELEKLYNERISFLNDNSKKAYGNWQLYEKTVSESSHNGAVPDSHMKIRALIDDKKFDSYSELWLAICNDKQNSRLMKTVYEQYLIWCDDNSFKPFGKKAFNEHVENKGFRKFNSGGLFFKGLVLKY